MNMKSDGEDAKLCKSKKLKNYTCAVHVILRVENE